MKRLTYNENPANGLFSKKFEFLNQLNDVLSEKEHVEQNKLLLVKLLKTLEVHKKKLQKSRLGTQSKKKRHQNTQTSFDEEQDSSALHSCTDVDISNPFLNKSESIVNSTVILVDDNIIRNGTKIKRKRKQGRPKKRALQKTEPTPIFNIMGGLSNKSEENTNKSNSSKKNEVLDVKDTANMQTRGRKRKLETSQLNKNNENIDNGTVQRRRSERIRTQVPKERWSLSCIMFNDTKKNRELYESLIGKKKRAKSLGNKSKIQQNSTNNSNTSGEQSTIHKKRKLYSVEDWVAGMLKNF